MLPVDFLKFTDLDPAAVGMFRIQSVDRSSQLKVDLLLDDSGKRRTVAAV